MPFTIKEFFIPYAFSIHYKLFILYVLRTRNFLVSFDNVGSLVLFFCTAAKAGDSRLTR